MSAGPPFSVRAGNDVDDEDDDARGENSLDTLHSIRYYQLLLAPGKH